MSAQIFLSLLLFLALGYAGIATSRAPAVGGLFGLVALAGLYFVWFPAHAMALANYLGIGRGVDLILYVWSVFSVLAILNLHLSIKALSEGITELARRIALSEATERHLRDQDDPDLRA